LSESEKLLLAEEEAKLARHPMRKKDGECIVI